MSPINTEKFLILVREISGPNNIHSGFEIHNFADLLHIQSTFFSDEQIAGQNRISSILKSRGKILSKIKNLNSTICGVQSVIDGGAVTNSDHIKILEFILIDSRADLDVANRKRLNTDKLMTKYESANIFLHSIALKSSDLHKLYVKKNIKFVNLETEHSHFISFMGGDEKIVRDFNSEFEAIFEFYSDHFERKLKNQQNKKNSVTLSHIEVLLNLFRPKNV